MEKITLEMIADWMVEMTKLLVATFVLIVTTLGGLLIIATLIKALMWAINWIPQ